MKKLITEYNIEESIDNSYQKKNLLYKNIQTTEAYHYKGKSHVFNHFYLDYAFRQKNNLISKAKNKVNLNNFCYELENTVSLNLEILLSFLDDSKTKNNKIIISNDNKSKDTSDTASTISPHILIKLIKSIKEKYKKKAELNKNKNELAKKINNKIYENKKFSSKLKVAKTEFRQKLHKINKTLDTKDNYLILLNKKFYNLQKHIDNIFKNKQNNLRIKTNCKNIYDVVFTNINYKKNEKNIKNDIEKYCGEISELKIDNELLKEELDLRNDEKYAVLIRCMEYYRRTNLNLFYDIKKLKISFRRIVNILDLLNLGYIVKFSKKKQEEEGNYEMEFSKLNKDENSIDLLSKINKNINISINFE